MPLHNDMIRFPQPNPSSHLFPVPDPKPEGENVRHKLIDDRWLAGEKTHIGILRDSEGTFCPEPSCGEYDCQLHSPYPSSSSKIPLQMWHSFPTTLSTSELLQLRSGRESGRT